MMTKALQAIKTGGRSEKGVFGHRSQSKATASIASWQEERTLGAKPVNFQDSTERI